MDNLCTKIVFKFRGSYFIRYILNFSLFKSFGLSLLQRVSLPLFGFGTFYILVRTFTEDELGQWALFIAITTFLEGAKDGLMKNALVHYLNSIEEEYHVKVKSSSLLLNLIVTSVFAIVMFLMAGKVGEWLSADRLAEMLRFYTINLIALVFFSHFNFIQQAKVSYLGIMLSYVGRQGLLFFMVLISIVFYKYELSLIELVYIQLIGIVIGTFISWLYTRKYLEGRIEIRKKWLGKMWAFGRFGMLTNISVSIITSTDHLMLGGMISTGSVAIYNVAVKITNFFNLPSAALSSVLLPEGVQSAAANDKQKLKSIFEMAVAAMLTGLLPSVLAVLIFPELIIKLIAGDNYLSSKSVLMIIILTTLIMPFFQTYGMIVNALGKPQLDFIFITTISVFNIGANYILIKMIGIDGAAYASLLTHLLGLIFVIVALKTMIGIELGKVGKKLIDMYVKLLRLLIKRRKPKAVNNGE